MFKPRSQALARRLLSSDQGLKSPKSAIFRIYKQNKYSILKLPIICRYVFGVNVYFRIHYISKYVCPFQVSFENRNALSLRTVPSKLGFLLPSKIRTYGFYNNVVAWLGSKHFSLRVGRLGKFQLDNSYKFLKLDVWKHTIVDSGWKWPNSSEDYGLIMDLIIQPKKAKKP